MSNHETPTTSQQGYFEEKSVAVNPHIDHILGLDRSSLSPHIHKFTNGMSGAATIHVAELGKVVKWNEDKAKIIGEAHGYALLADTLLAPLLLPVDTTYIDDGIISTPFYDGQQLREGVKNETIEPDAALGALSSLLTLKREWWKNQDVNCDQPENPISMQRAEWLDTITRITDLLPTVAAHFRVTTDQLLFDPLIVNGQEIPSLSSTLEKIQAFLETMPTHTVLAHNDATGANILVKPEAGEIKLIDYQWTGKPSDPAEAFVRMGKWVSTSMLTEAPEHIILSANGVIKMDLRNSPVNPLARQMQELAECTIPRFSRALNDPNFNNRAHSYMAGSYLRELALSKQRGGPESAMFSIIKAGESILKS